MAEGRGGGVPVDIEHAHEGKDNDGHRQSQELAAIS